MGPCATEPNSLTTSSQLELLEEELLVTVMFVVRMMRMVLIHCLLVGRVVDSVRVRVRHIAVPRIQEADATKHAAMGDALHFDHLLGERHFEETVLIVVAVHGRPPFGGDAATTTGDHPSRGVQEVGRIVVVELLRMHVASDHEVNPVLTGQANPQVLPPCRRKMRHHNLPVGRRLLQALLEPTLLVMPELGEPRGAVVHVFGAGSAAARARSDVHVAADVVLGVAIGWFGIERVRVHEEVVDREARVADSGAIILGRHHPASCRSRSCLAWRGPRVGDELVPTGVEAETTIVMVAEDTQPRLAVESLAGVDPLEVVFELPRRDDVVGGDAAGGVNARPVEVVAGVDDVVRRALLCPLAHLPSHTQLCSVIHAVEEVFLRALVGRRRTTVEQEAAPVANDIDAVGLRFLEAGVRQLDAIQVRGPLRRLGQLELRRTPRAEASSLRPVAISHEPLLEPLHLCQHLPLLLQGGCREARGRRGCGGSCRC
mmetsp:Transcript_71357/g.183970  ORF Transcript_71357/g.183970 Transcript_71357/m.183970 type:complete len:487 (+) Transcript_71357:137-1597(+)